MMIHRYLRRRVKSLLKWHLVYVRTRFLFSYLRLLFFKIILRIHSPRKKIVIVGLVEHFGDIVAAEPLSRYLKAQYPQDCLMWCVRSSYRGLLEHNPHIDKVCVVHCLTEWIYLSAAKLSDITFDLHFSGRSCLACGIPLRKNDEHGVSFDNYYSFGSLLCAFSRAAGIKPFDSVPRVYIPRKTMDAMSRLNLSRQFIVIHCLSAETARDWTYAGWSELVDLIIKNFQIHVVEIGTHAVLSNFSSCYYTNACKKFSIIEIAEIIRRASLFVGIDSGPAHLANAVGTYGIILLGTYKNFHRYMPYSGDYANGRNATIVYADDLLVDLPVGRIYAAVDQYLQKKHGNLHV